MSGTVNSTGTRFDIAFAKVDRIEGGFVNDPADRGGATNHGVTLRFLVSEGKIDANHDKFADYDLDMDGDIDIADLKALTSAEAKALFKRCFWDRLGCDALPAPIDAAVFDQGVNGGCVASAKLLQGAINRVAVLYSVGIPQVAVDGAIGPGTRMALGAVLKRLSVAVVIAAYRVAAADRYRMIAAADHSQLRFLSGWLARAAVLGA